MLSGWHDATRTVVPRGQIIRVPLARASAHPSQEAHMTNDLPYRSNEVAQIARALGVRRPTGGRAA